MKQKDGFSGERSIVLPKAIVEMEKQDPLVSSLYITDIGYYPKAENHSRERKEPIAENVLIYCMEGEGRYWVDT
ncbi:MAG: AraC family transcriptional regulator, partial [Prevotella sp.]|nr:AraC family transcriptional regulator [Prevotella sp.]